MSSEWTRRGVAAAVALSIVVMLLLGASTRRLGVRELLLLAGGGDSDGNGDGGLPLATQVPDRDRVAAFDDVDAALYAPTAAAWDTAPLADSAGDALDDGAPADVTEQARWRDQVEGAWLHVPTQLPPTVPPTLRPTRPPSDDALVRHLQISLGRPMCLVALLGTNVHVDPRDSLAARLAGAHPGCVVHVASNSTLDVWPPPPPFAFLYWPFRLVGDAWDRAGALLNAPGAPAAPPPGVLPVRATTFFDTFERNRMAAAVVRAQSAEDVAALADVLGRFPPSTHGGFLETIVLELCPGDVPQALLPDLLRQYGYQAAEATPALTEHVGAGIACAHKYYTVARHEVAYPARPRRFWTVENWGRMTNQLIEDANSIADVVQSSRSRPDLPAASRVFVPAETFMGPQMSLIVYNATAINERLGQPNRFMSFAELVSVVDTIAWCGTTCRHLDNAVDCVEEPAQCLADDCVRGLSTLERTQRWAAPGTPHLNGNDKCAELHGINDPRPGVFFPGATSFWFHTPWTPESGAYTRPATDVTPSIIQDFGWLTYGPVLVELAQLQMDMFRTRLRAHWTLPADFAQLNVIGLHMRLRDYDFASNPGEWAALAKTAASALNNATHGVVVCTDDKTNAKYLEVLAALPGVPVLECLADVVMPAPMAQVEPYVAQTLLELTTCFIGLRFSTFSWRIQMQRVRNGRGRPDCDHQLFHFGRWN